MWLKPKTDDSQHLGYSPVRTASTSHQKYQNERRPSRWNIVLLDTWLWEGLAMSFSILCFLAIVSLLRGYDQKTSPTFTQGITLNSIISVLSAASKSSMIYAVTASIGQLKWNWFYTKRERLQHIQLFDDASRGPWGSMIMLFSHRGCSLASLGAAITILVFAFDPFMQQILTYPIRQTASRSDAATSKQVHSFSISTVITPWMKAVNTGIWSDEVVLNPTCSSGNCTWAPFRSVSWCSQCENVTSVASLVGCTNVPVKRNITEPHSTPCHVSLPHGEMSDTSVVLRPVTGGLNGANTSSVAMELPTDIVWPLTPYWFAGNEVYAGVRGPLIAIAHAQLDRPHLAPTIESSPDSDFKIDKVTECALSLCVKTYNLSVSSGTPAVDVLSVDYGELFNKSIEDYPRPYNNGVDAVTCWKPSGANPNLIQLHNDFRWADTAEFSFCPVEDYIFDVQEQLKAYSSSPWTWLTEDRRWEAPAGYSISGANFIQILDSGLEATVQKMADSLTRLALDSSDKTVNGTVEVSEVYVAVNWAWITFPVIVLALGILFLVSTIVATKNQNFGLWKSAILPVLYHGLDDELLDEYQDKQATASVMDQSALSVDVKLDISDSRDKLVLRKQS